MNKEQMDLAKKQFAWGTKERYEISLREMIDSCWCYGTNCYTTHYISDYFNDGRLSEDRVWQIVDEQLDFLNNNCKVIYDNYIDGEGNSYASIVEVH